MNKLPDWVNIETVLLDMDGTLLDLHFDNYFWLQHVPVCYAEKHNISHDEAFEDLNERYSAVRGSLQWYSVDYWSQELALDIGQLKYDLAEKIAIRPEVVSFLSWLNHSDKRVVLVTNAHPVSLDLKMEKTGLHVHFDNIINSHDVGLAKEHEGFWRELQRYEAYNKDKTMLIDDNLEVLESAYQYGIGYCLGVRQPDSKGGIIESEKYHTIDSFKAVMPEPA